MKTRKCSFRSHLLEIYFYKIYTVKNIFFIFTTIILLCIYIQPALAVSIIKVDPSYIDVEQNDNFLVNITVDPAENGVYCVSYTLYFDNTFLSVIDSVKGPFLSQDGANTNILKNDVYNTLGKIEYAESRYNTQDDVNEPGVVTTITFEVIAEKGICSLNLSDLDNELLYSTTGSVPSEINNGRVGINQPYSPFSIQGYIFIENNSACNNPSVSIKNFNVGNEWAANTTANSNYYQLMLLSPANVVAGDVIRFNASNPDKNQLKITNYTITQDDMDNCGIEYNITMLSSMKGDLDGDSKITSTDIRMSLKIAFGGEYLSKADMDENGYVNILDVHKIMKTAL